MQPKLNWQQSEHPRKLPPTPPPSNLRRDNALAAAGASAAELIEAKEANRASQNFERVRLTREVIKEHTALTYRMLELFSNNWATTKSINDAAMASNDTNRRQLQSDSYIAISDCSALYAASVLDADIFMRRAALWILIAWYMFGRDLEANVVAGGSRLEYVSKLVHDAERFVSSRQPQFFVANPDIKTMSLPDPPPEYGGHRP